MAERLDNYFLVKHSPLGQGGLWWQLVILLLLFLLASNIHINLYQFFFSFETRSRSVTPGWSAEVQSWLTATSVPLDSSDSPVSTSQLAGITGVHQHIRLILYF